jgi:hypothetical protein
MVVNDESYAVVGVMPREFYFLPVPDVDVWLPASFPARIRTNFGWHSAQVVARLKPGVTMAAAADSMAALSLQVTAKLNPGPHRALLTPLREEIAGKTQTALTALLAAAAALLLIACVNLANLLMSRGAARGRGGRARGARGRARASGRKFHRKSGAVGIRGDGGTRARPGHALSRDAGARVMGTVHLALDWRVLACCGDGRRGPLILAWPRLRGPGSSTERHSRRGTRALLQPLVSARSSSSKPHSRSCCSKRRHLIRPQRFAGLELSFRGSASDVQGAAVPVSSVRS